MANEPENPAMDNFLARSGDEEAQLAALAEDEADSASEGDPAAESAPAEAPGETPAPEDEAPPAGQPPSPDAPGADAGEARPPRDVPIQALDEERGKRQELADQLAQSRQTIDTMNQRFAEFVQHVQPGGGQQPAQQTPEAPSLEDDPAANLNQRVQQIEQLAGGYQQQQQLQSQMQQAQNAILAAENEFTARHPDYQQALEHTRQAAIRDLQAQGYAAPQAVQEAHGQLTMAAIRSLTSGGNPAQMVYERAQAFGYQPQGAPAPAAQHQAKAHLTRVQAGQKANQSLSDGGGQTSGAPKTLEDLAAMGDEGLRDEHWDKLVGRQGPTFGGIIK